MHWICMQFFRVAHLPHFLGRTGACSLFIYVTLTLAFVGFSVIYLCLMNLSLVSYRTRDKMSSLHWNIFCFWFLTLDIKKPFLPAPLLDWNVVQRKMPWSIVLLLGGGFALADASAVCSDICFSLTQRWTSLVCYLVMYYWACTQSQTQ